MIAMIPRIYQDIIVDNVDADDAIGQGNKVIRGESPENKYAYSPSGRFTWQQKITCWWMVSWQFPTKYGDSPLLGWSTRV